MKGSLSAARQVVTVPVKVVMFSTSPDLRRAKFSGFRYSAKSWG